MPLAGGPIGAPERASNFAAVYSKTITERLGITVKDTWMRIDRVGRSQLQGWTKFEAEIKYLAIDSQPHEFLLTIGRPLFSER